MSIASKLHSKGKMPKMPYLVYLELMMGLLLFIAIFAAFHTKYLGDHTPKVNTLINQSTVR